MRRGKSRGRGAASLFCEDGTYEAEGAGVYVGRAHIEAALKRRSPNGASPGQLWTTLQMQPLITVPSAGSVAFGRSRALEMIGEIGTVARWGAGVYENRYRREAGGWRIESGPLYPFAPRNHNRGQVSRRSNEGYVAPR